MKFSSNADIKIGTILFQDTGWSMCIPNFYEVVAKKGKTQLVIEKLERLDSKTHGGCGFQGDAIPGEKTGNTSRATITRKGYLHINGKYASCWDGRPKCYDFLD